MSENGNPAATHCDGCGCDWLDNGLNPIGCPYCSWTAEVRALRAEVRRLRDVLKGAVRVCKDLDDEAQAREGRLACGAECAAAIEDLVAEVDPPRAEVEFEYELWVDDVLMGGGREADHVSAYAEAILYATTFVQEGPVEIRVYEKRLVITERYE